MQLKQHKKYTGEEGEIMAGIVIFDSLTLYYSTFYNYSFERQIVLNFQCFNTLNNISACADMGPRVQVCARETLCLAPHRHHTKFRNPSTTFENPPLCPAK